MHASRQGKKAKKAKKSKKNASQPSARKRARILKDLESRFGSVAPAASGVVVHQRRGSRPTAHVKAAPAPNVAQGPSSSPTTPVVANRTSKSQVVVGAGDLYDKVLVSAIPGQQLLPKAAARVAEAPDSRTEFVLRFTADVIAPTGKMNVGSAMSTKLSRQLMLDNAQPDKSLKQAREADHARAFRDAKRVGAAGRARVPELVGFSSRYADYLPLNKVWNAYIAGVCKGGAASERDARVARADLHGAVATVVSSSTPHHIGLCGIVVRVTPRILHIVTPRNKKVLLPRRATGVQITVPGVGQLSLVPPA